MRFGFQVTVASVLALVVAGCSQERAPTEEKPKTQKSFLIPGVGPVTFTTFAVQGFPRMESEDTSPFASVAPGHTSVVIAVEADQSIPYLDLALSGYESTLLLKNGSESVALHGGRFLTSAVAFPVDPSELSKLSGGLYDFEVRVEGQTMVEQTAGVYVPLVGDVNLDGAFDSGDLVHMLQGGKYETGAAASWSEGDLDGDGQFSSSDLVTALQGGNYETAAIEAPKTPSAPSPSDLAPAEFHAEMKKRKVIGYECWLSLYEPTRDYHGQEIDGPGEYLNISNLEVKNGCTSASPGDAIDYGYNSQGQWRPLPVADSIYWDEEVGADLHATCSHRWSSPEEVDATLPFPEKYSPGQAVADGHIQRTGDALLVCAPEFAIVDGESSQKPFGSNEECKYEVSLALQGKLEADADSEPRDVYVPWYPESYSMGYDHPIVAAHAEATVHMEFPNVGELKPTHVPYDLLANDLPFEPPPEPQMKQLGAMAKADPAECPSLLDHLKCEIGGQIVTELPIIAPKVECYFEVSAQDLVDAAACARDQDHAHSAFTIGEASEKGTQLLYEGPIEDRGTFRTKPNLGSAQINLGRLLVEGKQQVVSNAAIRDYNTNVFAKPDLLIAASDATASIDDVSIRIQLAELNADSRCRTRPHRAWKPVWELTQKTPPNRAIYQNGSSVTLALGSERWFVARSRYYDTANGQSPPTVTTGKVAVSARAWPLLEPPAWVPVP